ncbi:MAG: T9SS type A sorting domain-containing protein [Bacteroidia bacterium]
MRFLFPFLLLFVFASNLFALNSNQVLITRTTSPNFNDDSNNACSTSGNTGPHAAYVGFKIQNTSTDTLRDITLNLGNFVTTPTAAGLALGGGQMATQYVGKLVPNASDVVYWYVAYPCNKNNIACGMTLTAKDKNVGNVTFNTTITTRSSISANAGGLIYDTQIEASNILGGINTFTVTYSFGGVQTNEEFNMQPTGNIDFRADAFQLVNAEIISSQVPGIAVGVTDKLYFVANANKGGSGNLVKIKYYFQNRLPDAATSLLPYAVQTSGNTNIKYTGNYGGTIHSFSAATNAFQVALRANTTCANLGDTLTYKLSIKNASNYRASIQSVKSFIPSTVNYVKNIETSEINALNSMLYPVVNATDSLIWLGKKTSSYLGFEEYVIEGNDSLVLAYQLKMPTSVSEQNATISNLTKVTSGAYTQSASLLAGIGCEGFFPVILTSFTGKWQEAGMMLQWLTESEINSHHFEIERSVDYTSSFETMGEVNASGNSDKVLRYSFIDENAPLLNVGKIYYRLKMVDIDGTSEYSEILEVLGNRNLQKLYAKIYPNPASHYFNLEYQIFEATKGNLRVVNQAGQEVYVQELTQAPDVNSLYIDISHWADGIYLVNVSSAFDNQTLKLIKSGSAQGPKSEKSLLMKPSNGEITMNLFGQKDNGKDFHYANIIFDRQQAFINGSPCFQDLDSVWSISLSLFSKSFSQPVYHDVLIGFNLKKDGTVSNYKTIGFDYYEKLNDKTTFEVDGSYYPEQKQNNAAFDIYNVKFNPETGSLSFAFKGTIAPDYSVSCKNLYFSGNAENLVLKKIQ